MYCRECGNQLPDGSQFCDNCGKEQKVAVVATVEYSNTQDVVVAQTEFVKTNGLCITGFVLALVSLVMNLWGIMGIVATVFSAIGIQKCKERGENGHGLGVAGLVIGIVSIVFGLLTLVACAGILATM